MSAAEMEAQFLTGGTVDTAASSVAARQSSQGGGAVDDAGRSAVGDDGVGGDGSTVDEEIPESESESHSDDAEEEAPTPRRAHEAEVEQLKDAFIQGVIDDGDDTTLDPEQVPQVMMTSYKHHMSSA